MVVAFFQYWRLQTRKEHKTEKTHCFYGNPKHFTVEKASQVVLESHRSTIKIRYV